MNINEEAAIEVFNNFEQKIEVLMQEEVLLDVNVPLFYIKSGEEEIQAYVDNHGKPQLDEYTAKKIVDIEENTAENLDKAKEDINTYVKDEVNPSVLDYANTEVKPQLDISVAAAAASAAAALASEQNAAIKSGEAETSASAAAESALNAENAVAGFDEHVASKQAEFDTNAADKTTAFDENASSKAVEFNNNVVEKIAAIDAVGAEQIAGIETAGASEVAKIQDEGAGQVEKARIWATGDDSEVEELAPEHDEHSSRGYADLSKNSAAEAALSAAQSANSASEAQQAAVAARPLGDKHITNCLTAIPQDLKFELNNGTLTLKAGSKVYIPNGFEEDGVTPKFDVIVVENDITHEKINIHSGDDVQIMYSEGILRYGYTSNTTVGTVAPTQGMFYNTELNRIDYFDEGTVKFPYYSLPLCMLSSSNGDILSIDQVFNGFGYFGHMMFTLPGVKGLAANGRNKDGSLKNIEISISSVLIHIRDDLSTYTRYFLLTPEKMYTVITDSISYDSINNRVFNNINNDNIGLICGKITSQNGDITSFNPREVLRTDDYQTYKITNNVIDDRFKLVSAVPASPVAGTFYYIPV